MDRPRSFPAIACGVVAIALAVWAVAADRRVLIVVAAIAAVASVLLAMLPSPTLPSARLERERLEAETERLEREAHEASEQAARYQTEAMAARDELADALRARTVIDLSDRSGDAGTAEAPADATEDAGPAADDPAQDPLLDPDTGLFNQRFFDASLGTRIAAARRGLRPLSVAVVSVVTGAATGRPLPADPAFVRDALRDVFRESDTLARADDGDYLVLLEDTAESGAVWTLERLRRHIVEVADGHTTRAGLSCYPTHAFAADQMVAQAREALGRAEEWHQDRIEVTEGDS